MAFALSDVRGDGSCYYRCVWRIAREDADVARVLVVERTDPEDEDDGVDEIRDLVASRLVNPPTLRASTAALLRLHASNPELRLEEQYPFLERRASAGSSCDVARAIGAPGSKVMAGELEHRVVADALESDAACSLHLVVLSMRSSDGVGDIADKWLRELHKMLPAIRSERIAIVVNVGEIHYKVVQQRLGGAHTHRRFVVSRTALAAYVAALMDEDSE
jgi:hypothetical protein